MISILIVDDEYLIRSLVKMLIPWEQLGLNFVGEAADGEQAYQMIEAMRPDIVILDINLPIMNGLELARKLRENNFDTHIIFLTGYRNFEYAQRAVTYRAYDFLLKPISREELTSVLERLTKEIAATRIKSAPMEPDRPVLQESFLRRLCFGQIGASPDRTATEVMRHDLPLQSNNLLVLSAELQKTEETSHGVYAYALFNILQELASADEHLENVCGFPSEDDHTVLLANVVMSDGLREALREIGSRVNQVLVHSFSFTAVIGASEVFSGYDQIPHAVRAAMHCTDGALYRPEDCVFFSDSDEANISFDAWSVAVCSTLKNSLTAGEWQKGRAYLQSLFRVMRRRRLRQSAFRTASMSLAAVLYAEAERRDIKISDATNDNTHLMEKLTACSTGRELESVLLEFYDSIESRSEEAELSVLTRDVKRYVRSHYRDHSLGLRQISDSVHASQAYISSLFKRETGTSITEFVTACRLREAAELLGCGAGLSLAEIAQQTGWSDPYYFSKIFKKHFGVAPSKFAADSDWYLEADKAARQILEQDGIG